MQSCVCIRMTVMTKLALLMLVLLLPVAAQADTTMRMSGSVQTGEPLPLAQVLDGNGCEGSNHSPALNWQGVPAKAQSLAITVFDPDAKQGKGWWHWAVFNLSPKVMGLPENASANPTLLADAAQGQADADRLGYAGACPPVGDPPHHYIVTLWALDVPRLDLPPGTPDAVVAAAIKPHVLASTVVTPVYGRKP